jgi:hypothetical protein
VSSVGRGGHPMDDPQQPSEGPMTGQDNRDDWRSGRAEARHGKWVASESVPRPLYRPASSDRPSGLMDGIVLFRFRIYSKGDI